MEPLVSHLVLLSMMEWLNRDFSKHELRRHYRNQWMIKHIYLDMQCKLWQNAIIWTLLTCDKVNVSVVGRFTVFQVNKDYQDSTCFLKLWTNNLIGSDYFCVWKG